MQFGQEIVEWQRMLQERWNSESPTRFVPLDRYSWILDIKSDHLKPANLSTDLIIDWSSASDIERTTYQEFVAGIIDAAVDRKTGTLAHVDLEVERAIWSIIQVCKERGKMTPYLHGWTSEFTFGPGFVLKKKNINESTLGREGAACWNTDVVGPRRYVPPLLLLESADVHMDFLNKMRKHEEKYLGYDMEALARSALLKLFDKQLQKEMVQALRDIHAKRLIELIAYRKSIPQYWAEHATIDFPKDDKTCASHGITRAQVSRAGSGIWAPLHEGADSHLADENFSAESWSSVWKEHPARVVPAQIVAAAVVSSSVVPAPSLPIPPTTTQAVPLSKDPPFEANLTMHPARRALMDNGDDVTVGGVV